MIRTSTRRLGAGPCGEYPAASGFAAEPFRPLTAEENARYLAAAAVFNACMQTAAGAPQSQCPPGSSFQGGEFMGVWQGKCVSTFTGQPTTDLITQPTGAPAAIPINYATAGPPPPSPPIFDTVPAIGGQVQSFLDSVPAWTKWAAGAAVLWFAFSGGKR